MFRKPGMPWAGLLRGLGSVRDRGDEHKARAILLALSGAHRLVAVLPRPPLKTPHPVPAAWGQRCEGRWFPAPFPPPSPARGAQQTLDAHRDGELLKNESKFPGRTQQSQERP